MTMPSNIVSLADYRSEHSACAMARAHPPRRDRNFSDEIERHVEQYVGPIATVIADATPAYVDVGILWIPPTEEDARHTFVTTGMSSLPMCLPPGSSMPKRAELAISLPADWLVGPSAFNATENSWPVIHLKAMARYAHQRKICLGFGQTVSNGDPPIALDRSTDLAAVLLVSSPTYDEGFDVLEISGDETVAFYVALPLYRSELAFKIDRGMDALLERLDIAGISDMVDPQRENVCP